jgi:hypothetical protein
MRQLSVVAGAAALALVCGSAARANVIDATEKANKPAAKLRADIAKQVSKYTSCLVKAATKCELKGNLSTTECHLDTGVVDFEVLPGKETTKFHDAIVKCDTKLVLNKKGNDYTGIGCPGDCNTAPGVQQCADIPAFQATVTATTGAAAAKVQLGTLAAFIDLACSVDVMGSMPTDQARKDCVKNNAATLSKYSQGLFKCQAKCENDFKDKFGNGGFTNGKECNSGDMAAAAAFNNCDSAALAKAGTLTPVVSMQLLPQVRNAINTASNSLYNRSDPTDVTTTSPCGTCGNNDREGAEACDGADLGTCAMGPCKPDCTCP